MRLAMKGVAMAALLIPAACATSYSDIRAKAPYETRIYTSDTLALSDCALNSFAQNYSETSFTRDSLTFTRMKDGDTIHLGAAASFLSTQYVWDIAFVPLKGGQTRVEVRPLGTSIWGSPNYPSNLWQLVRGCASNSSPETLEGVN
jgi:hypothetical protein